MKKKKENFEQYCDVCGRALIRVPVPAEKAKFEIYGGSYDSVTVVLGQKYNKYTGLRQFGIRIMCPHAKWYNSCTNYIDENSLHDSNLPELISL